MKGQKTGGRKKGTPNKSGVELREMAAKYGPELIEGLYALAQQHPDADIRIRASKELLDRGFGRPITPVSGPDLEPLKVIHAASDTDLESAALSLRNAIEQASRKPSDNTKLH